jgi:hypothetical protein
MNSGEDMNKLENNFTIENKLMYDLIFGNKKEYEIKLLEYISNVKEINPFIEKILSNLKKSGLKIKEDILIITENKNLWILKIEK